MFLSKSPPEISFIIEAPSFNDFSAISLLKVSTEIIILLNVLLISFMIGITLFSSSFKDISFPFGLVIY